MTRASQHIFILLALFLLFNFIQVPNHVDSDTRGCRIREERHWMLRTDCMSIWSIFSKRWSLLLHSSLTLPHRRKSFGSPDRTFAREFTLNDLQAFILLQTLGLQLRLLNFEPLSSVDSKAPVLSYLTCAQLYRIKDTAWRTTKG